MVTEHLGMLECPHCGKLTPNNLNYCQNCGGAIRFSARFRGLAAKAKFAPTRIKAGAAELGEKAKTKALSFIGGGPKVKSAAGQATAAQPQGGSTTADKALSTAGGVAKGAGRGALAFGKIIGAGASRIVSGGRAAFSSDKVKTAGAGATIIFLLIGIALFFLQLLGMVILPGLQLNLVIFGALGIIAAIYIGKAGHRASAIIILVLIIGIGYGSWYTQATPLGKQVAGEIGVTGIQASQGLRSFTGPLNVMGQIFAGTYNPENLWRSDTVQSDYQATKDVGVRLLDIKPIRDTFLNIPTQPLVVQGRLDAVSFPKSKVEVWLSACSLAGAIPTECSYDSNPWTCCVGSKCSQPQLTTTEARNRAFSCNHAALNDNKDHLAYPMEVTVKAVNTQITAGKQFVFADPNALLALPSNEDPLSAFGISSDSVKSWQAGDESINLGLGAAGDPEVLETVEEGAMQYYIGVNVENPVSHIGDAQITNVDLYIPSPPVNISDHADFDCGEPGYDTGALADLGFNASQTRTLRHCVNAVLIPLLKPGDRQNLLLGIQLNKSQLSGQDFSTFFVLANVTYDYTNKQTIPLVIKTSLGGTTPPTTPVIPGTGIVHLGT